MSDRMRALERWSMPVMYPSPWVLDPSRKCSGSREGSADSPTMACSSDDPARNATTAPPETRLDRRLCSFPKFSRPRFWVNTLSEPPGLRHVRTAVPSSGNASFPYGLSDRKSTRLNSSHVKISYAVFCLKKKNKQD